MSQLPYYYIEHTRNVSSNIYEQLIKDNDHFTVIIITCRTLD